MIHFVGAGPGAADLITVRGARLLSEADLVVWAGSLVSEELLGLCRDDARILDSSGMTLEEIVGELVAASEAGLTCVRLQTGDVTLFGALPEQTAALDAAGIPWEVVPGVSSVFAVAAALGVSYTAPGLTQTLVVTRLPGRTPVPGRERLAELAAHHSSLAILLSAGQAQEVADELMRAGYAPDEPVACVAHASWADERVLRCSVATLAACLQEAGVTRGATIVVSPTLAGAGTASCLYDAGFSHLFREAAPDRATDEREPCASGR